MDEVFYYSRMTKISIIKSSNDLDNKELFPISSSLSQKVWKSSDSDTKDEEDNIDPAPVNQICWNALVSQCVIYGRKENYISTLILQ